MLMAVAADPDNRLLWRMPRRRLSVESYRDAVLAVVGRLDSTVGGQSIQPDDAGQRRRTLYSEVSRMDLNPMLARFDFPDPNAHSAKRVETTTPLQKLFLLNSPFLVRQSDALASRLESARRVATASKIEVAYQWLYGRAADENEVHWGEEFVADGSSRDLVTIRPDAADR